MKMKSVAAICRNGKYAVLFDRAVGENMIEQYVSDGGAIYPITGLPELGVDALLTVFDVPPKDRDSWAVKRVDFPENVYSVEDVIEKEWLIERLSFTLSIGKRTYILLKASDGVAFIDEKYFAPLKDINEPLELYERRQQNGQLYVAVKAGMILHAIILPVVQVVTPKLLDELSWLSMECALAMLPAQKEEGGK